MKNIQYRVYKGGFKSILVEHGLTSLTERCTEGFKIVKNIQAMLKCYGPTIEIFQKKNEFYVSI